MTSALPIILTTKIKPEWLDYNNHVNIAYYTHIFDLAGEALADDLGFGQASARARQISWMVIEAHVTYDREITLDQKVAVSLQLLDCDHKRIHLYSQLHVTGDGGYRAATQEQMIMCVDLARRRSTDFPDDAMENITSMMKAHADFPLPKALGRRIGIRRN